MTVRLLLAALVSWPLSPAALGAPAASDPPLLLAQAPVAVTEGEVRKVDREQGKLTLRHGPIANLEMQGMTMVFRVADPRMLEGLNDGDKVRFTADKVDGAFVVTSIEPAR